MKIFNLLIILIFVSSCASSSKNELSFDAELSQFKYPFPVKTYEFSTQTQKLKMRYMDIGKSKSKVAVLLHGKNFAGFYWERIANDLVKKGYRVIIPDQIGFGKSSKPDNYHYSFPQLAKNTHGLIKSLGVRKYIVVGHSMGGMLAVNMGAMYRDIRKVVLVNPIGLEAYLDYVEYKDPEFFFKSEMNKTVDKARAYQRKNYYDGAWSDSYEALLTPFKGQLNGPDYEVVAWNAALTYGPIFEDNIVVKFPKIKAKTVLILGTRDRTGPGRGWKRKGVKRKLGQYQNLGREIKKENPKLKLIELKGLGHMPQFEDYNRFSKVFFREF
ncbi:putative lysophospholipase [Halobacteriovorax sp. BALOs_7]|uniref:alpha/beta fold hydrolase n=1 Tax=unclassified Halobacteriovorax TaxID=2639665 RepID=UPI000EA3C8FF|nr:alpha/beta hydrolase [Halobacteriovorax sp. BALOs_7]AYF43090.1 putative lysophospholipase [Halobacteriovorax sp. BALOs_7]